MLALCPTESGRLPLDLQYAGGKLVDSGYDLFTAYLLSLFVDAPAKPGDPVPKGKAANGWWAQELLDTFDDTGPFGSRLWLMSSMPAVTETVRFGEQAVDEALEWMIGVGMARSVSTTGEIVYSKGTALVKFSTSIVAPNGARETLEAWQEVGG